MNGLTPPRDVARKAYVERYQLRHRILFVASLDFRALLRGGLLRRSSKHCRRNMAAAGNTHTRRKAVLNRIPMNFLLGLMVAGEWQENCVNLKEK